MKKKEIPDQLPCLGNCGIYIEINTKDRRQKALKNGGLICWDCVKKRMSERMKTQNPMSDPLVRAKLITTLKKINHKPKILGWKWTPTMFVGQGCKVHLKREELPGGTLIVSCSKHLTVVIDGVLNDIFDCSRNGTRCVYGYWTKAN